MKKTIALMLALLLGAIPLAACSSEESVGEETVGTSGAGTVTSETVTATTKLVAEIPDSDFKGYEFKVLARGKKGSWDNYDIQVDSANGDIINDALYNRNVTVADKLNVKFVLKPVDGYDVKTPVMTSVLSGADDYDIVMPSITDAANIAQGGALAPLQKMPYMDLEKPWYDDRCIEQLAINGKNYLFFSDINVCNLDAIWIYLFNKKIAEDFKLDDPYQLMADGTWTTEKMTSMSKTVTSDLNGDGKMNKSDRWGLVGHDYVITAAYIGSGERVATAGKDGKITLTMNNKRVFDVINSIIGLEKYWIRYSLTAKKYSTASPVGFEPADNYAELISVFKSGNALFIGEVLAVMEDMRDSDIEFGVVPTPKLDDDQEGYFSAVNSIAAAMCVPLTAKDLNRTSIVIEAWAAESHYTVIPAYYEIAMKSKYTRDIISADMLDLILGSRSYDLGIYYGWGGLSDRFCSLVYEGSTDFASMYDANKAVAQDALDKFVTEFK